MLLGYFYGYEIYHYKIMNDQILHSYIESCTTVEPAAYYVRAAHYIRKVKCNKGSVLYYKGTPFFLFR